MDVATIRRQSIKTASSLGYPVHEVLPLLDRVQGARTSDGTVARLLCLHAAAACAYGFDEPEALDWLRQERAFDDLAPSERRFLESGDGDPDRFKVRIEGMWALAWTLGLVAKLDFGKGCDKDFVRLLPDLHTAQSSSGLRAKVKPRSSDEILEACDLAYCLHCWTRQAQLGNRRVPGKVPPFVVEERRRALDWLLGDVDWDEVSLDT